jgi:uncharacterized metal-binding protein
LSENARLNDDEAKKERVLVIPCSGIGKVHGLLSREATYLVVDELARALTDTLCLALLVKGDPEAVERVRTHMCITIDGCGKACAQKNVEMAGGEVGRAVQVASALCNHRGAQPGTASALTEDGCTIAREIAETVASEVACRRDVEDGDL